MHKKASHWLSVIPFLCIFLFIFALPARAIYILPDEGAATNPTSRTIPELEKLRQANKAALEEGQTSLEYTGSSVFDIFGLKIICSLIIRDECKGGSTDLGAINTSGRMIGALFSPPATTETYVADVMNSAGLGIVQPARAQGLGFSALDPVLNTWKVLRNVAYIFYVIIFLIIGFLIMFRQKINNQTAITAQQALPQIILSLLAVTFSYAIAGLLIDAMYLVMYFMISMFASLAGGQSKLQAVAIDKNIFQVGLDLFTGNSRLGNAMSAMDTMIQQVAAGAIQGGVGDGAQALLGFIGGIVFGVVFAIALIFSIFRLFFELLKTYVSIIIAIVLSPLALMLGALPNNNAFGSWIKSLVANLAVFPATMLILILFTLLSPADATTASGGGFLPPYLIGAGSAGAVSLLISFGIILILPDIIIQVKSTLGGKGGIFEQFANNLTSSLEKGWKGGELIPGLGASDTRKWLGKQTGGLSGENLVRKGAIVGATAGRSLVGGYTALGAKGAASLEMSTLGRWNNQRIREGKSEIPRILRGKNYSVYRGMVGNAGETSQWLGDKLGDEQFKKKDKK